MNVISSRSFLACFLFFFVVDGQLVRRRAEGKVRISFDDPVGLPFVGNEQDDALFMVFDDHGAVDVLEVLVVVSVILDPAGDGVGQAVHFQIDAVFVLQPVFEDFELQLADGADNVAFHGPRFS